MFFKIFFKKHLQIFFKIFQYANIFENMFLGWEL